MRVLTGSPRPWAALLLVGLLSATVGGCLDAPHDSDDRDGARFQGPDRPGFEAGRAVVAVIDTGANVYHEAFRRSDRDWRAVDRLPRYPDKSYVLPLTLDEADLDRAVDADAALWDHTREERLYDVPGTAFVGLIAFGEPAGSPDAPMQGPGLDEVGHGTATSGMVAAHCPDCLLVAIEVAGATEGRTALSWAATQEWIDIVVYPGRAGIGFVGAGTHHADPETPYAWARANAEAGQVVVVAAGNGPQDPSGTDLVSDAALRDLSYSYWTAGPDWVVTVGAANARAASTWHTYPVDIVAEGEACDAPHPFSRTDRVAFEGTSCSAPIVGGQLGEVLRVVRDALGDGATGPRSGQRLVVPDRIDQPAVTREDLVRAYYLTATGPSAADPVAAPLAASHAPVVHLEPPGSTDTHLGPMMAGWGLHDATSLAATVAVLTGTAAAPQPDAEASDWFPVDQRIRLDLWGDWARGESRIPFPEPFPGRVRAPEDLDGLQALYAAATGAQG